jgi:hypothetical protein
MGDARVVRLEPYASHFQFIMQDARADHGLIDGDSWVNAVEDWRIAAEPHAVAVATARYDTVPVLIDVRDEPLAGLSLEAFEHVVEVGIDLPSGELAVLGSTQLPTEVEPIRLPPGCYRMRIGYEPTDYRPPGSSEDEPGEYLNYVVLLWPTSAASGVTVLKQGPSPWAY